VSPQDHSCPPVCGGYVARTGTVVVVHRVREHDVKARVERVERKCPIQCIDALIRTPLPQKRNRVLVQQRLVSRARSER